MLSRDGVSLLAFFVLILGLVVHAQGLGSLLVHKYSTRVVKTKYGPLRGVILQHNHPPVEAFLGVPYATPPVGSLRYMPPVTPSTWRNPRLADSFSPVCPQRPPDIGNRTEALLELPRGRLLYLEKLLPLLVNQSEDCLYLNIYVPRGETMISNINYRENERRVCERHVGRRQLEVEGVFLRHEIDLEELAQRDDYMVHLCYTAGPSRKPAEEIYSIDSEGD